MDSTGEEELYHNKWLDGNPKSENRAEKSSEKSIDTEELIEFRKKWKAELHVTTELNSMQGKESKQIVKETIQPSGCDQQEQITVPHLANMMPSKSIFSNEMDQKTSDITELEISSKELFCKPSMKQKGCHISALPLEIFQCILSFAVLPDLDLRTLEQFGMVCKGFYVLARETFVWKKACLKLWGDRCSAKDYFNNWRLRYISHPHVHFNGVYISRSSYVRNGEHSLDNLYRPFHLVFYYRYLRFYTNGTVVYLTSPQEPGQIVSQLKHKTKKEGLMFGQYIQTDNVIHITVSKHVDKLSISKLHSHKPANKNSENDRLEQLQMELEISNSKRNLLSTLKWKRFSHQSLDKSTTHAQATDFKIDQTYSSFKFSRVASYTMIEY